LSVSEYSGIAYQPANCIVPLKNLTAAFTSSSFLRETFKVNLWLMRRPKSSESYVYCISLVVSLGLAHVLLV
jgi:hypothetical protein